MLNASSSYLYNTGSRMQPVYRMDIADKEIVFSTRGGSAITGGILWQTEGVEFQDEGVEWATGGPTVKEYMQKPRGNTQQIVPDEGKSSIGQVTIPVLDKDNEVTTLIATDSAHMHRHLARLKAGYMGMEEEDMLTVMTGWITDIGHWGDMLGYDFVITDPQRYFQKKLFRYATNSTPVYLSGNPMNILLALLTSTGSGTNGAYDWYNEENGIGIDYTTIDISHIEEQRDHWFPGERWSMNITKPIVAKRFLEDEFFKMCNLYPVVRGDGTFDVKAYHSPIPTEIIQGWQGFDEDVIIGLPRWDQNLSQMINEVQTKYDHDATEDEFDQQEWHLDSDSLGTRGPGKKPLILESRGIRTGFDGDAFMERRAGKVFDRYAVPPPRLKIKTFFSRHLSEPGDIVPVSHSQIPNLYTGSRGVSSHWMEITNRSIDWERGCCDFELLHTGWQGQYFMELSPSMRVSSGVNEYQFVVQSGDGLHYDVGYRVDLIDYHARSKAANITVNSIVGDVVTVTSMGITASSGDFIQFASSYTNLAEYQIKFWAIDSLYQILA